MSEQNTHRDHFLKLLLAFGAIYIIWGSTYLAIRYAVETIPPLFMMGTRSLVAGTIIFLFARLRGDEGPKREHLPSLFIIGAAFFLFGHGLLAWAEKTVPSGLAALLVGLEPGFIAVLESMFIRGHKVGVRGIAGLVLGFAGIVLLVNPSPELGTGQTDILGILAITLGTFSWSVGAVYTRTAKLPKSSLVSAGLELMIGGTLLLAAGIATGEAGDLHGVTTRSMLSLSYLIVFGSIVAFSAYVWLLSHTSATRVATSTYVNPVIAIFLGWAFAGEGLSLGTILATFLIVVSIYFVLSDPAQRLAAKGSAGPAVPGEEEGVAK